ncbi:MULTISPECIES: DUF6414 family protein [Wohlfahrtiimonas]|uniref:DUF6414 family protein n=1 Tax=Wohlfahrtiimonas TaxID=582472 RepID=UPI000B98E340|nr:MULTISPECIES: hypothetical protein [Wohlfahrtiimonas]MBS7815891.1 hypothetical protein [Wohlfahrtiimonas chitiniclastica]MBS7822114.1 hypothetical protein [Wohlfahrtiimonas chitiniclastica]MBS7829906.1 hypothetical protein [Wohlfahrtiimonas chitiniclastica]MBS7831873.1 hypothetical protein [Wohlfahrtiimonas chitiniclastica]OYQ69126.1 hypothetical protein B9T13_10025 [Wohlfahrtiimonas chitiniclastica]
MQENDQHEKDSLYDFMYVDLGKLKSYCSQLDDLGLLNAITTSETTATNKTQKFGTGKNPFADLSSESKTTKNGSLTHTFDHMESLPFRTIEMMNAKNLISLDIENTNYGQIIYISGNAKMYDLSMLASSWENLMKMHEKNTNISKGIKPKKKDLSDEGKMIVNMLETMPPLMSFKIKDENGNTVWAALEKQHLIGHSFGYALKHGAALRGKWNVLGILDAKPYNDNEDIGDYPDDDNDMLSALNVMGVAVRTFMGRKESEFGITPIAIWRMLE